VENNIDCSAGTSLQPGVQYYYRVEATGAGDPSGFSNTVPAEITLPTVSVTAIDPNATYNGPGGHPQDAWLDFHLSSMEDQSITGNISYAGTTAVAGTDYNGTLPTQVTFGADTQDVIEPVQPANGSPNFMTVVEATPTAGPQNGTSGAPADSDLTDHGLAISLNVNGVSQAQKNGQGGIVLLDNGTSAGNVDSSGNPVANDQPSWNGHSYVDRINPGADKALVDATLAVNVPAVVPGAWHPEWELNFGTHIKVWANASGTWTEVVSGQQYYLSGAGMQNISLKIQGVSASTAIGDAGINARLYVHPLVAAAPSAVDSVPLSVVTVTVHPNTADFLPGMGGRVMLFSNNAFDSAIGHPNYYTSKVTTLERTPAQTIDGYVTADAELSLPLAGNTVYFRLVNPNDLSPYTSAGDSATNSLTGSSAAVLPGSSQATLVNLNGSPISEAEVQVFLGLTAGNKFQVEASFDPNFDVVAGLSAVLVPWKRVYIENDTSYTAGATILGVASGPASDTITVDSTATLHAGQAITVFSPTASEETTIATVTANTITVPHLTTQFSQYDGVRPTGNVGTYPTDLGQLAATYGMDTYGDIHTAYVEFLRTPTKSVIPLYAKLPSYNATFAFANHWFLNASVPNVDQLATLDEPDYVVRRPRVIGPPFKPAGQANGNQAVVFADDFWSFPQLSFVDGKAVVTHPLSPVTDTVAHEIGHTFPSVNALPWVDAFAYQAVDGTTTSDLMSYGIIGHPQGPYFSLATLEVIRSDKLGNWL
jgi:hypothetical protein